MTRTLVERQRIHMEASDHIYIHVPFCDGKCFYCSFYSEDITTSRAIDFLDCLEMEFELATENEQKPEPETIYLGGGTPSILPTWQFERLCEIVLNHISTKKLKEWTVEVNPGTLTADKIDIISQAGINRVSIGAQSFDDEILKKIGRRHDSISIARTIAALKEQDINNVGVDLIACLPEVDMNSWQTTLTKALELETSHISVYALSIESGTEFHKHVEAGNIIIPDDTFEIDALSLAEIMLGEKEYSHYEISNYALSGYECQHNLSCWRGRDYMGFGPSASSRKKETRSTNIRNIDKYIESLRNGKLPIDEESELSPEDDLTERLVFAFRLEEGVDLSEFCHTYGMEAERHISQWTKDLTRMKEEGLTELQETTWLLTKKGRLLADYVAQELMIL